MKFYTNDFAEGVQSILKTASDMFSSGNGNLFPHHTSQSTWKYSKKDDHLHLSDGTHTYSFKGNLGDADSELERVADIPLPSMFENATVSGKAQVHRSDPGSIYFTLQEGRTNPTYTLRHSGDRKWKAIPKARTAKQQLAQPVTPHNVNLETVKAGMLCELEQFRKVANDFFHGANQALGQGVDWLSSAPKRLAMFPATIGGSIEKLDGNDPNGSEPFGKAVGNAALSAGLGAGAGGLYHLLKREVLNTPEENTEEDENGGHLARRMMIPAGAMALANVAGRQMFPTYVNNPEIR